jgi:hypothetical protein
MSGFDRARAKLISGPVGRGVAFATDLTIALAQGLRTKLRNSRS